MDIRKSEFRVAGATQDATSAERCDLTQDPSITQNKLRHLCLRSITHRCPSTNDCSVSCTWANTTRISIKAGPWCIRTTYMYTHNHVYNHV